MLGNGWSTFGNARQKSSTSLVGTWLVLSTLASHGMPRPKLQAATDPLTQRHTTGRAILSVMGAARSSARVKASATHSGEAGPMYRSSGWSIVPMAAQYGTGSLYATGLGGDVQPNAATQTATRATMAIHFDSMRPRLKARRPTL